MLDSSTAAPGHALQGPDLGEPEPDSAGIYRVSPEQVKLNEQRAETSSTEDQNEEYRKKDCYCRREESTVVYIDN